MKRTANLDKVGIAVPRILFPTSYIESWSCIACDQHTSDPAYWEEVQKYIGNDPSSLDLMMPEAWLFDESKKAHQENIPKKMRQYEQDGTLKDIGEGFMFIHRQMSNGYFRRGLLVLLDLDKYEYEPGNKALCRATEGVVEERLPARIEIREKASLEMPHAMVLLNDKSNLLMGQLDLLVRNRQPYYNAELMMGGGMIRGWFIHEEKEIKIVENVLTTLAGAARFAQKGMLFAVGDGNHSLAAAKKCKNRYAMVELVNINDPAMEILPIHRLLNEDGSVADYIHDADELERLAEKTGLKPELRSCVKKEEFFKTFLKQGLFEKKSFSLGRAVDKRYYLECRSLKCDD